MGGREYSHCGEHALSIPPVQSEQAASSSSEHSLRDGDAGSLWIARAVGMVPITLEQYVAFPTSNCQCRGCWNPKCLLAPNPLYRKLQIAPPQDL